MSQAVFWLLLLLGVALIGGVIAFLGDSVGRRVGRKHLRLFGLRPKTTGLVFAVGSGVLVALFTVGTVALLARSTVDNALRAQDIYRELQQAKQQYAATTEEYQATRRDLEASKQILEASKRDLEASKQELQRLTASLETERAQLQLKQNELSDTTALNGRLSLKVGSLEAERNAVNAQIAAKTAELERLGARSKNLERQGRESAARIQNLGTELKDLEAQRDDLNRSLNDLNAQRLTLDARIKELSTEKAAVEARYQVAAGRQQQLEADVKRLDASRGVLLGDVAGLQQTKSNLENSVSRLESQNADLQRQLSQTESQLNDTQNQLAEATSGNFIFRQGDMVGQSVVEGTTADEVRARLQAMLQQANKAAQAKGAPRSKQIIIKPTNDLEPYVRGVLRTSTPDLVIVRCSRSVTQTGIEFPVTIQVFPNTTLYSAGQPIVSRELSLAVGAASVRVALENLGREAEQQLREQSVPRENIATLPDDEINGALDRLKVINGTVWVAVASRQDVLPSGPIRLYLTMLR